MSVYLSMNLDGLVFSFISEEEQRYRSSACMCTYDGSDIKYLYAVFYIREHFF